MWHGERFAPLNLSHVMLREFPPVRHYHLLHQTRR